MPIYRGDGGSGDSSTDAYASQVAQDAQTATTKANEAAASATEAAASSTSASSSATTATTQATAASTSATNASTSETNAATSATNAATSETNAEISATSATSSATNAAASKVAAAASETAAATSETNAATSETNAATSATSASTSATNAATSETNAATSETNAATSATNAATSATNAATSETNAAASYDSFDDRYLGAKSSDPSVDNDGDALITGALYFNSTSDEMKVYSGSSWNAISSGGSSTLSGLTDVTITSVSTGQVLKYNGTAWVNDTDAGGIALTDLSVTTNAAGTAALSYNNTSGVFSYTPPDLSSYLTSYTETDTLDSVTGRGNTTTNAVTVGAFTSTGIDDNATSNAITIDSSQNVGIGTSSPTSELEVNIADGSSIRVRGGSNLYTESSFINFQTRSRFGYDDSRGVVEISDVGETGTTVSKPIVFDTHGAETMRIDENVVMFKAGIEEQEYNLTGTDIDPANGTIQYITLAADTTFTSSLANGEFVTLMIDDGSAYTITWPTTKWIGGSAPTLITSGYNVIELWRVNGNLYGAFAGATQ